MDVQYGTAHWYATPGDPAYGAPIAGWLAASMISQPDGTITEGTTE